MADTVPAAEFARNFGRYKLQAQREAVPISRNETLTICILRTMLPQVEAAIECGERQELSERDSMRVLDLLEHPPAPSARLLRATKAGFTLE